MAVNSWSHSKLMDFEKCKKYFWLKHDQRIPEPEHQPAYCPTHAPDGTAAAPAADLAATLDRAIAGHHDTPPAPTGGDVALNSPSLEQSVAAALGATVHTPHHD